MCGWATNVTFGNSNKNDLETKSEALYLMWENEVQQEELAMGILIIFIL